MRLVEERIKRRESFLNLIKKNPGIELDQAIGQYSNETGLSSVTIRRYLYELVSAGLVKVVEGLEKRGRFDYQFKIRLYPQNPMHPLQEDLR
jgi:predicted ArsR family transcriptional regulator